MGLSPENEWSDILQPIVSGQELKEFPQPQTRLGSYILLEMIGAGGFATVWRAEHVQAHTKAAVKVFNPMKFQSAYRHGAAMRFVEGATAMRRLDGHKNIVKIHEGPSVDNGFLWFSMEMIDGKDLHKALLDGNLDASSKLSIVSDLIDAVAFAHSKDIVHRDIRPPNILVRATSQSQYEAVLTDFDIAYFEQLTKSRESTALTGHFGVIRYWPQDVMSSASVDVKTKLRSKSNDLYAISVVLFDMFCGINSQLVRGRRELGRQLRSAPKASFREKPSQLNRTALTDFLSKGLSDTPEQRFQDIAELRSSWQLVSKRQLLRSKLLPLPLILSAFCVFVLLDLARGHCVFNSHRFRAAFSLFYVIPGLPLCAAALHFALRGFGLQLSRVLQDAIVLLERRPMWVWLPSFCLLLPALALSPDYLASYATYGIVSGGGCIVTSSDGSSHSIIDDSFTIVRIPGEGRRIKCNKETVPTVITKSLLQESLLRVEVETRTLPQRPESAAPSSQGVITRRSLELSKWDRPLSEREIRQRLLRAIRGNTPIASFIRNNFEKAIPSNEAPVFMGTADESATWNSTEKRQLVSDLRSSFYKMTKGLSDDNRAVRLAIHGHLAALVLDCQAVANNYGLLFGSDSIPDEVLSGLSRVWAMDAARCLEKDEVDADDVLKQVLLKNEASIREFAGLAIWVIQKTEFWRKERHFVLRSVRTLESHPGIDWDTTRSFFLNEAVGSSADCETVRLGLEMVGHGHNSEIEREKVSALQRQISSKRSSRGAMLRRCRQVSEQLTEAISRLQEKPPLGVFRALPTCSGGQLFSVTVRDGDLFQTTDHGLVSITELTSIYQHEIFSARKASPPCAHLVTAKYPPDLGVKELVQAVTSLSRSFHVRREVMEKTTSAQ